jgi:Uma2 family endonuclease
MEIVGLSVDEFLDRGLEDHMELVDGETRPKPLPDFEHSGIQVQLVAMLLPLSGRRLRSELGVRTGDSVLVPYLVVTGSDSPRLYRGRLDEPPLLCIEIVSPSQTAAEVPAKCERYHAFGVPFCWVVDPAGRRAWEYHRHGEAHEVTEALTGQCVLPLPDVFG